MTPKQLAFVREYQVDRNCTQAAIRAGYSPKTAYSQGQKQVKKAEIAAAIEKNNRKREERVNIEVDAVVEKLYAGTLRFLAADVPAEFNAGINGANRLAKMQGWDAPDKSESGRPGEFDSLTGEELDAKIAELAERIKKP